MRLVSNPLGLTADLPCSENPFRRFAEVGLALDFFAQRELEIPASSFSLPSFLGAAALEAPSVDDSLSGVMGGAEVVTCGRIAFLRLLVMKVRWRGDAEACLEINCLWVAHRMVLEGASSVDRGDALARRRASAALRSSIDLFVVSIVN
jgi:hypothetical protein